LVDEAACPVTCVGTLDQRVFPSSPTSSKRHKTHLGVFFSSIGMLSNSTGKHVGFIYSFLLAYNNTKLYITKSYDKPFLYAFFTDFDREDRVADPF
jgi:hypothetical protein